MLTTVSMLPNLMSRKFEIRTILYRRRLLRESVEEMMELTRFRGHIILSVQGFENQTGNRPPDRVNSNEGLLEGSCQFLLRTLKTAMGLSGTLRGIGVESKRRSWHGLSTATIPPQSKISKACPRRRQMTLQARTSIQGMQAI